MCEVCVNAHFGQLHLNAHPLLKLFPGCTCYGKQADGGGSGGPRGGGPSVLWSGAAAAPARTEWEAADRHFQGLPIGRQDAKAVRSLILRRSLLLRGGGVGPLAEMVNVSRSAGRTPLALIAKMLSIPFSDPDFTAPDLPVATLTRSMGGHTDSMRGMAVLPDGRLVTVSSDATVKVWVEQVGAWSLEASHTAPRWSSRYPVYCVACDVPLGAGPYGVKDADELTNSVLGSNGAKQVRFVTGSSDGTVRVWVEQDGAWSIEADMCEHRGGVQCVAVLPPLPFGPVEGSLAPPYGVEGADGSTNSVLGSNSRFITGGHDTMVKVWVKQGSTWSVEAEMGEHGNLVWCVAVLPLVKDADGSTKVRFVTGSHDKTMKVWVENSPGTWSVEATLKDRGFVLCMAVLPDGRFVTGSSDGTVKVWKENTPGTWSVEATLKGHLACVNCVAVLPDGRLATGSSDKRVKVWVENSQGRWSVEATLKGHSHYVHCVAVFADGRLATGCTVRYGSHESLVIVWG